MWRIISGLDFIKGPHGWIYSDGLRESGHTNYTAKVWITKQHAPDPTLHAGRAAYTAEQAALLIWASPWAYELSQWPWTSGLNR